MTKTTAAAAAVLVAAWSATALAGAAFAGDGRAAGGGDLTRADANGDGVVEWAEVQEMRATMFARLDRDENGVVNAEDRPRGPIGRRFDTAFADVKSRFDADADGGVSRTEFVDAPAPAFEAADADGDRVLSAEEIAAAQDARAEASAS